MKVIIRILKENIDFTKFINYTSKEQLLERHFTDNDGYEVFETILIYILS